MSLKSNIVNNKRRIFLDEHSIIRPVYLNSKGVSQQKAVTHGYTITCQEDTRNVSILRDGKVIRGTKYTEVLKGLPVSALMWLLKLDGVNGDLAYYVEPSMMGNAKTIIETHQLKHLLPNCDSTYMDKIVESLMTETGLPIVTTIDKYVTGAICSTKLESISDVKQIRSQLSRRNVSPKQLHMRQGIPPRLPLSFVRYGDGANQTIINSLYIKNNEGIIYQLDMKIYQAETKANRELRVVSHLVDIPDDAVQVLYVSHTPFVMPDGTSRGMNVISFS